MEKQDILYFIAGAILIVILVYLGVRNIFTQKRAPEKQQYIQACIQACNQALAQGRDLTAGPCLLDPIENSNWVCDVAHDPRTEIDELRENQCDAWHAGTANHFVEVTPECEFIKAI